MNTKQIMDEKGVRENLDKIIKEMLDNNPNVKNLVLIGILTRGYNIAERIRDKIKKENDVEVKIGALDTRPYRDDVKEGAKEDKTDIPFNITGTDAIIVDDVMSTGRTIRAAMDALISHGRPKSIKTAVLIDRGHRELPISADYVGTEIPTSITEKIKVRLKEVDGGKDGAFIVSQ